MKALLIALCVVAFMVGGMLVLKLPPPAIIVAPETVFHGPGVDITNTMFTSWFVVGILVLVALIAGRGVKLVPSGFAGYVEAAVMALYGLVEQVAGPQNARKFFPLIGTIFFFIITSNYFGLLPMNNIIGKPEPGHGNTQAVFQQTTIAGVDLAFMPLKTDSVKVAAGEAALLPEGYVPEHGEGHEAEGEHGAEAGGEPHGTEEATPHSAALGSGDIAVSSVPGGNAFASAPLAEGEVEYTTDGSFSGILAPYFRSVNTDINAPLAIAIFSFIFVEFWGLQALGFGYLGKFFAFGAIAKKGPLGAIDIFVGILEFVSELSRIVSFTFRLFGNIFAGEVLLLMMTFLVPFVLVDAFYMLELFVGLIQAFVFAMLTTVFASMAVTHHGDGEHHDEGHEASHNSGGTSMEHAPAH